MKISTLCAFAFSAASVLAREHDGCHGDNCANQVTGTFGGIGIPTQSRMALCNSFLRTTIKPAPTTVTSVVTKYTTKMPGTTGYGKADVEGMTAINASILAAETIVPGSVPTFAAKECPSPGQFSSACACWGNITAATTTLARSTATATTTTYLNVGCSPATTAVSKTGQFPCSRQWGMCSCLRSEEDGDVCVKVGQFGMGGGPGYGSGHGPCEKSKECNAKGGCDDPGMMCVYDGSCKCGKRRCYKAAPRGCEYQGIDMDDSKRHKA